MDDLLGICDDGCLDETGDLAEDLVQEEEKDALWACCRGFMVWRDLACRLQQIHCNGIDGKNIFTKQNSRNQNWMLSWWDTGDVAEDLVQEEPCELDAVWYGMRTLLAVRRFHCCGIWWQKLVAQQALELRTRKWMFVGMWVCATYIKCISCMMTLWRTEKRDSHMCVTIARSWVLPFGLHHQQSHLLLLYTFQESLECAVVTSTLPTKIHLQRIVRRATNCKKLIAKDSYVCVSHSQKLCHHTIGVINNTLPGTTTFHSAIFKNPQECSGDFCTAKDLLEEQAIIAIMWIDMAIAFVPLLRSFLFLQRSYWWLKPCVLEAHVKTHLASFDARDKNMLIECSVTKLRMVLICVWWIIVIRALQHGIATSSLCNLLQVDKSFCCCYKTCCWCYLLNLELVTFLLIWCYILP